MMPNEVQAALMLKGLSYRRWALKRGVNPRTVTQAVKRHAGQSRPVKGLLTHSILRDLSREIGRAIIPGALEE